MTTLPIGPALAPAATVTGGTGAPSTGGELFLALVQGLLGAESTPTADLDPSAADQEPEESDLEDQTAAELCSTGDLAGPVAATTVVTPRESASGQQPTGESAPRSAITSVPVQGDAPVSPTIISPAGPGTPAAADAPPGPPVEPRTPVEPSRPAAPARPDARPAPGSLATEPGGPAGTPPGAPPEQVSGPQHPAAQPTTDTPVSPAGPVHPAVGTATAGPTSVTPTTPASTTSAAGHQVTGQVFPEVVRLTGSAGPTTGPQRVTVRLNPESLGEVRVVLTQRNGGLEITLAGGAEARRALVDGAPELQRLLESVGRGEARIVVRDLTGLPVASTSSPPGVVSTPADPGPQGGSHAGADAGRSGGGPGPDRGRPHEPGRSNATDGTPVATSPSRPTETVTRGRHGLDVRM